MASHNQLRGLESWNLHMFFFLSAKMLCNDLSEDFFHQYMMVQWCHASPRSSGRGQERIVRNENPILGFKFRRTASSDWSGANPLAFAQGRTFHNIHILYIYKHNTCYDIIYTVQYTSRPLSISQIVHSMLTWILPSTNQETRLCGFTRHRPLHPLWLPDHLSTRPGSPERPEMSC